MLNCVNIQGRLTDHPELMHTPGGNAVIDFTIAVEGNRNGDGIRRVDFIKIVAWNAMAEFICKYFKKVSKLSLKVKYPLTAMLTETATKEKMSMCLQRVLTSAEQNHQKQAKKILQKPLTAKKNLINRRKTK